MMLEAKKVKLFIEAANATLQKSLVKDLEDPKGNLDSQMFGEKCQKWLAWL